ncbi:helix-turn-helix domain-containing protein [Candidatus Falkowbacteria bacterium]|nr:helix-turn-helix domain-containing protein [Candidatus Falkowbacteria bacterium]
MDDNELSQQLNTTSEVETLDVAAVTKSLGVSRVTVLRWIRAGKLEGFFRIGSKWLIRKADFDNLINKKINNTTN